MKLVLSGASDSTKGALVADPLLEVTLTSSVGNSAFNNKLARIRGDTP